MAERKKSPREIRYLGINLAPQMSTGATLTSLQCFAWRIFTEVTTLTAQLNPEDPTATLDDNPGVGALLIVHPGDTALEERFKVQTVTPSAGNFICGITPTAEQLHISTTTVQYQPGVNIPFLVNATPAPSGTIAPLFVQQGADGQSYHVEANGLCSNGERVEDEVDVDVVEFLPDVSEIIHQPASIRDVTVSFGDWIDHYNTTLLSAIAFVSRESSLTTSVNGANAAGASTLNINASPGIGALLLVNMGQDNQERLLVSAVTGATPPFTCTVSPLQFSHTNAEPVSYQPGVTIRVLTSANPVSVTPATGECVFRIRKGQSGQEYYMAVLGTLADGQVAQKNITLIVVED